jgi:phage shock protein A
MLIYTSIFFGFFVFLILFYSIGKNYQLKRLNTLIESQRNTSIELREEIEKIESKLKIAKDNLAEVINKAQNYKHTPEGMIELQEISAKIASANKALLALEKEHARKQKLLISDYDNIRARETKLLSDTLTTLRKDLESKNIEKEKLLSDIQRLDKEKSERTNSKNIAKARFGKNTSSFKFYMIFWPEVEKYFSSKKGKLYLSDGGSTIFWEGTCLDSYKYFVESKTGRVFDAKGIIFLFEV